MRHSSRSSSRNLASSILCISFFLLLLAIAGCSSKETGRVYIDKVQPKVQEDAVASNFTPVPLIDEGDYSLGDENAPVVMIEFSDYQCPFCREFYIKKLPKIKEDYIDTGKVRFIFKDFPLVDVHENSLMASLSANCAGSQGKYWEMHDLLYEKVEKWNTDNAKEDLTKLASSLGLDREKFIACISTASNVDEISEDIQKGRMAGVKSTPTFIINSKRIEGSQAYADFQTVIEGELGSE